MSQIDKLEYAKVHNKEGYFQEYCHGTYEEIESYCKEKDWYVDRYFDHVNPSTVQKGFRYIGPGTDPVELQRGFNYDKAEPIIDDSW